MRSAFNTLLAVALLVSTIFSRDAVAASDPPRVVFLIHEREYDTKRTVPEFAREALQNKLGWKCTYLFGEELHSIPGLEALQSADLMFVSVRRQVLPPEQFKYIKEYCESGKPIVGIRTASHAFATRRGSNSNDGVEWPGFDPEILGGNYDGHHSNSDADSPQTRYWTIEKARSHPILRGLSSEEQSSPGSLYKVSPLAKTATPLLMGRVEGDDNPEPVAWTNIGRYGNRVFYTSLGHPDDFESDFFGRLLLQGILWALGTDAPDSDL